MVKLGTSRRLKKSNSGKKLRRRDIFIYLMEVFLIIFGITVAYQLNVVYEEKKDLKLEIAAIEKVHSENQKNLETFENLIEDRLQLENDTRQLTRILFSGGNLEEDSISHYLFDINRTHKPFLQFEATNYSLNTNYTNKNSDLKNELISLKAIFQELRDVVDYYAKMKEKYYSEFLVKEVDFGLEEILSLNKIKSVEFKNLVINLLSNEQELNALFDEAYALSVEVDELIASKLD